MTTVPVEKQEREDMRIFQKKEPPPIPYDPRTQQPALRSSICTGEMTLGFVDRETGKFHEYELARGEADVVRFCRRVGAAPEDIKRIY